MSQPSPESCVVKPLPPEAVERQAGRVDFHLPPRKSIVIGRDVDCDVVLKDAKSSRKHCRLTRNEVDYTLEDLNSRNGTFVDGKRINGKVTLQPSHSFKVGDTLFYLSP